MSALSVLVGGVRASQAETTTEVARQDPAAWILDCDEADAEAAGNCQISQSITVRETGQRIVTVVVQKDVASTATHMLLALPHRIHLPSGVDIAIEGRDARNMAIETCDDRACYASLRMDATLLDEMRDGATMEIVFHNLAGKPVTLPLSLQGFRGAFDRLP